MRLEQTSKGRKTETHKHRYQPTHTNWDRHTHWHR